MDFGTIDLFVSVARRLSFAAVGRERNLDPSSVSRTIADLETQLGVRLFQRTTRAMTLTEAGEVYLSHVEPLVEEIARAGEAALNVAGRPRGTLRLSASVTFGQTRIVPLLAAFRRLHPELRVECVFTDANLDLIAERIDLAVRLAPVIEGDVVASKLMDTIYHVVASPDYLASHTPLSHPGDLAAHRVLLFDLRAYRSRWLFRDAGGAIESVAIDGDIVLSPAGSLRAAALAGLGPALLPDWLIDDDLAKGLLVDVFPQHRAAATTFDTAAWLIYPSRSYVPGKVRAMIDFLRAQHAAASRQPRR